MSINCINKASIISKTECVICQLKVRCKALNQNVSTEKGCLLQRKINVKKITGGIETKAKLKTPFSLFFPRCKKIGGGVKNRRLLIPPFRYVNNGVIVFLLPCYYNIGIKRIKETRNSKIRRVRNSNRC